MKRSMRRRTRWFALLLVVVLATTGPVFGQATVEAQVEGMTYVSPSFGYSIRWPAPWYVTQESSDALQMDYLTLSDGAGTAYFAGGRTGAATLAEELDALVDVVLSYDTLEGVEPLDAAVCPQPAANSGQVVACYRAVQRWDDGSELALGILLKAWDLGGGVHLLMDAYVAETQLERYLLHWDGFEIAAPGEALPVAPPGCDVVTTEAASFCFEPDVSERDRSDILEGARLGHDLIARYFGDPAMGTVRINAYSTVRMAGVDNLATTLERTIVVYTGTEQWALLSPLERILTMVHESFHVYQNVARGENYGAVPAWFNEGSAEAVGYLAASTLGVTDQAELYAFVTYSLSIYPVSASLSELEGYDVLTTDAYPLSYLAVQYLLGSRGLSVVALGEVYSGMGAGATFDAAFETVFGVTPDVFSAEFDEWRAALPTSALYMGDIQPVRERDAPAAPVSPMLVPDTVAPGDQLLVVAQTGVRTDCAAELRLGAETIRRETLSNTNGEVFWLISIPETAAPGTATLWLGCGSAPARAEIVVA